MKENRKGQRLWCLKGAFFTNGNAVKSWRRIAVFMLIGVATILIFHGSSHSPTSKISRKELLALPDITEPESDVDDSKEEEIIVEPIIYDTPHWNTTSFRFEPIVSDWDQRRGNWLKKNVIRPRLGDENKSRVMIISGTKPTPCFKENANNLLLRSAKSKLDYARQRDMQFFFNMGDPYPDFDGWWVKLPLIRMLMLRHPEIEWFWWIDSDAVMTDMSFEPPFDSVPYKKFNMILYGDEPLVYENKSWIGVNTGVYALRNCQWSLDLIDAWGSLGPKPVRKEASEYMNLHINGRPPNFDSDDQSGLVYLLVTEKAKWAKRVKMETNFAMSGNWVVITPIFEELAAKYHAGLGDHRWPLTTHFAGCQPCSELHWGNYGWGECMVGMTRSFAFGDNQTYMPYGFKAVDFNSFDIVPIYSDEEMAESREPKQYKLPGPKTKKWDKHRQLWLKKYPTVRTMQVLLATGSRPTECDTPDEAQMLLRAMKNKVDYCRLHDIELFYNMAVLDKELNEDAWSKLPVLRTMMLSYPEVEWIWWLDSDAVITHMEFEIPLKRYQRHNLVIYGDPDLVFQRKSTSGLNTGNFLIRNCQWSLDLLDAWAAMGPLSGSVRDLAGLVLRNSLSDFPMSMPADDQSALVYLLSTAEPRLAPKVFFEKSFVMGGDWTVITDRYEDMAAKERPFVTHFEGCRMCQEKENLIREAKPMEDCLKEMDRAFHFAENQVLREYGLEHEHLSTPKLVRLELASDRLLAKASTS